MLLQLSTKSIKLPNLESGAESAKEQGKSMQH
jgi:hypothetical protein